MAAGRLDRRLTFEAPREIEDGAGNFTSGFVAQFTQAANVKFMRGGESVLAARLEAAQPAIVTIRASTQARAIAGDWRAVDARAGMDEHGKPRVVYQIKELPRESEDDAYLEMLVVRGVAG